MTQKIKRSRLISLTVFTGFIIAFFFFGSKLNALADDTVSITAKVLAPPVKPIVTISSACVNDQSTVSLSWPSDENSDSFSIDRDSSALITGLATNSYVDENVTSDQSYTYEVSAHGTMGPGIATSDPVTITAANCSGTPPQPAVKITTFGTKDVQHVSEIPRTDTQTPLFSGTTNIPNATIEITVHSSKIIYATTSANVNGYWTWRTPEKLSTEKHTIFVKSVDPLDSARTASTSFVFIIKDKDSDDDNDNNDSDKNSTTQTPTQTPTTQIQPSETQPPEEAPVEFSVSLDNDSVFQGKNLSAFIRINTLMPKYDGALAKILYKIIDENGNEVLSFSENSVLSNGLIIPKDIAIPDYVKNDRYQLQTEISFGDYMIVNQRAFEIKVNPAVKLEEILPQRSTGFNIWLISISLVIFLYASLKFTAWYRYRHHRVENKRMD